MRAGRGVFWAVQYHPEYNLYELARLIALNTERLVAQGYAADNAAVRRFIDTLDALHVAPTRKDLRWQLGVDEEIVNEGCREREFANWLRAFVRP